MIGYVARVLLLITTCAAPAWAFIYITEGPGSI